MKRRFFAIAAAFWVVCPSPSFPADADGAEAPATNVSASPESVGGTAVPPPPVEADTSVPEGVDPAMTSRDPLFGLTRGRPVKVGSKEEFGGPAAQKAYFESLRDERGRPVTFRRKGNVGPGPDGSIVDVYEVTTSTGRKVDIYIDMYHPDHAPANQPAPAGFFKALPDDAEAAP